MLPWLEIVLCQNLDSKGQSLLGELFTSLSEHGEEKFFHPHALTSSEAKRICNYQGKDLYAVACTEDRAVGYGMLRGWDEGFDIPSLGMAVHPESRGLGVGNALLHYLHSAARLRKAKRIRLTVEAENHVAISVYKKADYVLQPHQSTSLIGYKDL